MGPIDADRIMYKNIIDSNCIEQDILPKNNINDAIEYLKNNEVPQIDELYQALFKRETFRYCSVYISDKNNSKIISAANVGIQHDNIDPNELQQLVDFAYEYDKPNMIMVIFACYLLQERIHPLEDGYSKMGRLLFLENIYQLAGSYVPLSLALRNNKQVEQLMNDTFKHINFGVTIKKRQIRSGDAAIYRLNMRIRTHCRRVTIPCTIKILNSAIGIPSICQRFVTTFDTASSENFSTRCTWTIQSISPEKSFMSLWQHPIYLRSLAFQIMIQIEQYDIMVDMAGKKDGEFGLGVLD
ncbi:MAG: hypothetical protein EZS28_007642 [Streblomastix strix]|uniref:Fido domain-containing protein n=1 Tax=Streblomastix strix TaxID=222440 RepID=A0A5J4WPD0_9EUKA|nr:MAG: hypothetical protein EZS28_007642 [Streblomastix strix]